MLLPSIKTSILITLVCVSYISLVSPVFGKTGPTHNKVVVCYISTWAVYRPGRGAYSIKHFDPNLCTHAVYAFAGLDIASSQIKSLDPWQDLKDDYGNGGFEQLTSLKQTHPHLKVSLAIGGWNEGSKNYSILVSDSKQREKFVKQVTGFVKKYNFDGLDLDWEYPTQRGGMPKDRENFVLLTKDLRQEFDRHNLILTSAIGASKTIIDQAYNIKELSKYLDFLHIMCYDYHGSWDKKVGANSPLEAVGDDLYVKFTIDYLIKMGAPPAKLVMGVPFYGRTFRTPFEGILGDDADDVGFQGPFTREDGFLGYNEICHMLSNKTSEWNTSWDALTSQAIAVSPRDEQFGFRKVVTYDNARSIANKVKFAMQNNLAGIMVWSIDTDDFLGECQPEKDAFLDYNTLNGVHLSIPKRINSNYPLLRTINEATVLALELQNSAEENEIPTGSVDDRKGEPSVACSTQGFSIMLLLFSTGVYIKLSLLI